MKVFLIFILSISLPCFSQSTYDDVLKSIITNADLSDLEQRVLKRDLKLQSELLEAVLEIEIKNGKITDLDSATSHIENTLRFAARSKAIDVKELVKGEINEIIDTTINPSKIKQQIIKIEKFVRNDLTAKVRFTSTTLRKFGIQVGLYYLIAVQVDYTIPAILMALGHYKIGMAMFAVPFSSTTTAIFASIKSNLKYLRLLKTFGVKESFNQLKVFRAVRNKFNQSIFTNEYLVDVRFKNTRAIISIEQANIFSKMLKKIGFNKNFNWENLYDSLIETNLKAQLNYLNNTDLSSDIKILRILQSIERSNNTEAMSVLKERFNAKIQFFDNLPDLTSHKKWFIGISHSRNLEQIFSYLIKMPQDIEPVVFDRAWRRFVLPNLANSFGDHLSTSEYKSFRKLFKQYEKNIYPLILDTTAHNIHGELREIFIDYIYNSFSEIGSCNAVFKIKKGMQSTPFLY